MKPFKTIIASMEGIKVELYLDRAARYIHNFVTGEWKQDCEAPMPIEWGSQAYFDLTKDIGQYQRCEVLAAIRDALTAKMA